MNPVLNEFVTHLEFLGYEIVPQEEENSVLAKHQTHGNTFVKAYLSGVLLQQYWKVTDKVRKKRHEFLEAVNQLNAAAHLVTYVAGSDDNPYLRMDGLFLGTYDKKKFGLFLEAYMFDTNDRILGNESIRSFVM
ncbi:MAG: hypothetical protein ONB44_03525 [candidate division KSB1 bacterium]|nr:hypothetical protein [candidate division KSB1 bacterium]MDZ7301198.1 hypothetical protein [candidate division KSB1 bacterium]MDZ7310578.1 hypothetical protein [candidate division KSB1 bacterium]